MTHKEDILNDELKMIRFLRRALAAIWTGLETDTNLEDAADDAQIIATEALQLSVKYCKPGKDLTDDTRGMESWRRYLNG